MSRKIHFKIAALAAAGVLYISGGAAARAPENANGGQNRQALLKTAAGCTAPVAAIDLDINNVRARIMTAGNQWYDVGSNEARYEIPKGSRKNSLYAGALWVGGFDTQGQLKVTAQTYRSGGRNDYWTGPLNPSNNNIDAATCNLWDRFWKVNQADILRFRELSRLNPDPNSLALAASDPAFDVIKEWPARGNVSAVGNNSEPITYLATADRNYAPFIDVDGDGRYDWTKGDYPGEPEIGTLRGDQFIWRVYNDMGNSKTQTGTLGIGIEIQASAFAYSTKDYLNDASFYNYRLINRGNLTLDSCYTATWTDADLGFYNDDYIGADSGRGLGILYNATAVDGSGAPNHYGNQVPMVGVDFFIGPAKYTRNSLTGLEDTVRLKMANFTYFTQGGGAPACIQDPEIGIEFYRYMSGTNRCGDPFTNDFPGVCGVNTKGYGAGPKTTAVFTGELGQTGWTECCSNNPPGDRRFVHSAGPFQLRGGGVTNDITIGVCWVANVGGCGVGSFSKIKLADDAIQELFDNNFRTIEGPQAPFVTVREMDRKLIMYFTNKPNSNNFGEKFGYDISEGRFRVSTAKMRQFGGADSLYKFEGYRVFQVKNANIQPAQIFGEDGELDETVATEVFQTDIKNGVTQLTNFSLRSEVQGSAAFRPEIKVEGKDDGIKHSFTVTTDAFATTAERRLVNYRNYYFIVVAYASNNFRTFNSNALNTTQDRPYLESGKGQDSSGFAIPIPVIVAMPNPANGDMGTVLNSDYGTGVKITRVEGIGNGGNPLQMDMVSEDSVVRNADYRVTYPTYNEGNGPVSVKVVDPLKVKEADWELRVTGSIYPVASRGIIPDSGRWSLTMNDGSTPVTIFSERNIRTLNEQILSDYGISVSLAQVARPGEDPTNGNNGLISSDVSYIDPSLTWLTGVPDGEDVNYLNWIRSGSFNGDQPNASSDWVRGNPPVSYDPLQVYEKLLSNNSLTTGTWAPYMLTANRDSLLHSMMPTDINGPSSVPLDLLQSVDVVFTNDKSKWTRCVVVETESDSSFAEGRAQKFYLRRHAGWNKDDVDANGTVTYNSTPGMSWFPGYAINQETGERLNIFFGEDSYLKNDNGADMLWNPSGNLLSETGTPIFGGKHFVWVTNTKYDSCRAIYNNLILNNQLARRQVYVQPIWAGMPMSRANSLLNAARGFIPTETRLRFRVTRPYARYNPAGVAAVNNGYPLYKFSTKGLGPKPLSDAANTSDKQALLDLISVVPNPYFGRSSGYEANRLDTRVRIINLPRTAEISIYSLDGSMVRRLGKDNPNVSYVDWDLRNMKGLPVSSGMYLIHVRADGIGETVLRFFGATRPLDVTNY